MAVGVLAYAQSENLNTESGSNPAGDSSEVASPVVPNWDSLYAVIQQRYLTVEPIVRAGCYDCHSEQTRFPWYHSLPVIGGWIDGHIKEAREHLDLTPGFPFKGHTRPADDLLSLRNEVVEGHMPPLYYRVMHWNAKPTGDRLDSLIEWTDRSLRLLAVHGQYPLGLPDLVPGSDSLKSN